MSAPDYGLALLLWLVCLLFLVGAVILGGWDGFAGALLAFVTLAAEIWTGAGSK